MIKIWQHNTVLTLTILAIIVKCIMAYFIPVLGDEAYFMLWGNEFRLSYYDHPPATGWYMAILLSISDNLLWLRMPSILTIPVFTYILFYYIRNKLCLAKHANIFFYCITLSPLNLLTLFATNDALLLMSCCASFTILLIAETKTKQVSYLYVLAGIFIGLAIATKFFAILLALAYCCYFITLHCKELSSCFKKLCLIGMGAAPFIAIWVTGEYIHGWSSIMFNIFNRNSSLQFSFATLCLFSLSIILLMNPYLTYLFVRNIFAKPLLDRKKEFYFLPLICFMCPMVIFAGLAFFKTIGLHWVIIFYPMLYLFISHYIYEHDLYIRSINWSLCYSLIIILLLMVLILLANHFNKLEEYNIISKKEASQLSIIKNKSVLYDDIKNLQKLHNSPYIMSTSYSFSAILNTLLPYKVGVWGIGSQYGRYYDYLDNFHTMDNKNIAVIFREKPEEKFLSEFKKFFGSVSLLHNTIDSSSYYTVLGKNFLFLTYCELYLAEINKTYYALPYLLPYKENYMDKYKCLYI